MSAGKDGRDADHKFRAPVPMWEHFMKCVELRDDPSASWVIRQGMARYIAETHRRQRRGDLPPFPGDEGVV
jgi:hypothetical protein